MNGSVLLKNTTELTYSVPANTSLLNITGPVYNEGAAWCYFLLNPEPFWWSNIIPTANPARQAYRANQSLMLLPLDPTVEYELIVGAGGSSCAVSGVTSLVYTYVSIEACAYS